jgi:sulfofructose kinase
MQWDIIGLGCASVDDLLYVSQFPKPDEKIAVQSRERQCGGLTGTALVTASRLGAHCAYAGLLGRDELSVVVEENFRREGVDVSFAPRDPAAQVVYSLIVVAAATGSRNIFFQANGRIGAHESLPSETVLRSARVLFLDQYGMTGNLRAARVARSAGVAVVADLEDDTDPRFDELLALVDHVIVSESFARKITGATSPQAALECLWETDDLWDMDRQAVVVTCGAAGTWFSGTDRVPRHQPAFRVPAVDTTGCGDVFHGAYAAALIQGMPLAQRVAFAAAAAALKATKPGGQRGIPTRSDVEVLLAATASAVIDRRTATANQAVP